MNNEQAQRLREEADLDQKAARQMETILRIARRRRWTIDRVGTRILDLMALNASDEDYRVAKALVVLGIAAVYRRVCEDYDAKELKGGMP